MYQSAGLITASGAMPFIGNLFFFGGPPPDSTLLLLSFSFENRALTFTREGDRYRGMYRVRVDVRQGSTTVRHIETQEMVRVGAFKDKAAATRFRADVERELRGPAVVMGTR